jgi:ferritin-like metal-binding protein YciE
MPTKSKAASKHLNDLFLDTLKDIYYAEKQILRALPKMAKAADSDALRKAFEDHRVQTQGQIERLDEVFEIIAKRAQGKTCEAILGIIEEGKGIIEEFEGSPALDAGLISAAQAVEHYEIARYGTLKAWAEKLGMQDVAKLLDASLEEERATDELLTKVAETAVNAEAMAEAA